ncbi:unnamed protein product [Ambrosiozyma monospora]|uniref:Unnamed protein product n=1 Tax=Ambrosiozyma monospora TaxID=43982 RepID=A0A9W6YQQ8_AMBMO|nr:unnamed protein product [Ambrosiozyma monospora]
MTKFSQTMSGLPFEVQDIILVFCYQVLISVHGDPLPFISIMSLFTSNPKYGVVLNNDDVPHQFQVFVFGKDRIYPCADVLNKFVQYFFELGHRYRLERLTVDRCYWESSHSDDCEMLNYYLLMKPLEFTMTNFRAFPFRRIPWFDKVTTIKGMDYNRLAPSVKESRFPKLKCAEVKIPTGSRLKIDLLKDLMERIEKLVLSVKQSDEKTLRDLLDFHELRYRRLTKKKSRGIPRTDDEVILYEILNNEMNS